MRIAQYLADEQIPFETLFHPPAFTAQKRARFLHIPGRFVLKSVLVKGPYELALAVVPATQQVDLSALEEHWPGRLCLATEEDAAQWLPDCERGALPPFGRLYNMRTFLDVSIPTHSTIVFPAQRHAVAIRMRCRDYERLERPERLAFGI